MTDAFHGIGLLLLVSSMVGVGLWPFFGPWPDGSA
jgi:hypothetical protein